MREIKFRAWDLNDLEMWCWDTLLSTHYRKPSDNIFNDIGLVLQQYTGVKDKNGVEVYEGDIVRYLECVNSGCCVDGNRVKEVMFKDGGFVITKKEGYDNPVDEFVLQVIGNIYENKELLDENV